MAVTIYPIGRNATAPVAHPPSGKPLTEMRRAIIGVNNPRIVQQIPAIVGLIWED